MGLVWLLSIKTCDRQSFENTVTMTEENAWVSFKEVAVKFLGNHKDSNSIAIAKNMLEHMKKLRVQYEYKKIHFFHSQRHVSQITL